jgi:hypothetical protein
MIDRAVFLKARKSGNFSGLNFTPVIYYNGNNKAYDQISYHYH